MAVTLSPRDKFSPPKGRPYWVDFAHSVDLYYLSWGVRFYGRQRLKVTPHTGWTYVAILEGRPTLDFGEEQGMRLKKGDLVVIHPDSASGWRDEGVKSRSEVLCWIWLQPPDASIAPPAGGVRVALADNDRLDRLHRIHRDCRHEVQLTDGYSFKVLAGLRVQLEAEFGRAPNKRGSGSEAMLQFTIAERWLKENLRTRSAISLLREYLQISILDLEQLFRKSADCTPAQFHHRLRMERARELVSRDRMQVKAAAFELGYAHPNDLSRAFYRHTGKHLSQ
jgi:AraC-like DNA-binding protein